jgi:hypothetical protein
MEIRFNIIGVCTQEIQLVKDCPLTEEEIMDALNGEGEHTVATTVQENGDLVMYKDGQEIILGKVVSSDVDGEYDDFADPDNEFLDDEELDEDEDEDDNE